MTAEHVHSIFDLVVHSDVVLRSLPRARKGTADIVIRCHTDAEHCLQSSQPIDWYQEWKAPDGQVIGVCGRLDPFLLIRFPGHADFLMNPDEGVITCRSLSGVSVERYQNLSVDQVIPRRVCHWGRLVVHASAVKLAGGQAVAFVGETGRGKSTLASAYRAVGATLLTDDALLLEKRAGVVQVIPSYGSLRLWPDSRAQTALGDDMFANFADYTSKKQLVSGRNEPANQLASAVSAIFLLGDPARGDHDGSVSVEPVIGQASMMALIQSSFVLDTGNAASNRRHFEGVGEVVESGLPIYRLDYPRTFELLPDVQKAIEGCLGIGGES